ncbi:hypothetical protein VNO77_06475 [Canavalia gladiata]|uniref:Glycosyl hydrolase family 32 C-terminal domain-containing protein n=1 Tax=Canavalia gladiata TaxID=3824 RepID=A0AAN9MAD5_CANGL
MCILFSLQEKLSLRSSIDHSVVESFGGEGRACNTARVYPTLAFNDKAQLNAFNSGTYVKITRLSVWSMRRRTDKMETKSNGRDGTIDLRYKL